MFINKKINRKLKINLKLNKQTSDVKTIQLKGKETAALKTYRKT